MHGFAARMPHGVDRRAVVESARLDDEGVALPAADGISEIGRKFEGGGKFASIRENLAVEAVDFVQNHRLFGRLNDFERFGKQPCHGPAVLAMANIVDTPLGGPPLHRRLSCGRQNGLSGLQIGQDVEPVLVHHFEFHPEQRGLRLGLVRGAEHALEFSGRSALVRPDARQIRLAVRAARRRRGEIRLSVFQPRRARRRVVEPLRVRANRQENSPQEQPATDHS